MDKKEIKINEIEIRISGRVGAGKTTIAMEIGRFLETMGFRVNQRDEDMLEASLSALEANLERQISFQPKRLDALKRRHTMITIDTITTRPFPL